MAIQYSVPRPVGYSELTDASGVLRQTHQLGVILVIVLTPRDYLLAFAGYAVIVTALVALSQVPMRYVLRRLWPVLPFLLAALILPVVATGERVDVGPVSLAVEGLRGGLVLGCEDTASRMNRIGRSELDHGRQRSLAETLGRIEAVTTDDVAVAAAELLSQPLTAAVVGPYDGVDDLPAPLRDLG